MSALDLDALERLLFTDPRSVLANKELGAYKMRRPREGERILDSYDVLRLWRDVIQRLREAERFNEHFRAMDILGASTELARLLNSIDSLRDIAKADRVRIAKLEAELALATSIDPRTYGAVGDGVTDDTPAFQAAVDIAHLGSENMKLKARIAQLERVRVALLEVRRQEDAYQEAVSRGDYDACRVMLENSKPARDQIDDALAAVEELASR